MCNPSFTESSHMTAEFVYINGSDGRVPPVIIPETVSMFDLWRTFLPKPKPECASKMWTPFHPMYKNSTLCTKWFVHQANATGAFIYIKEMSSNTSGRALSWTEFTNGNIMTMFIPALFDKKVTHLFNFLKWWRHGWRYECVVQNMHNHASPPPLYLKPTVCAISVHFIQIVWTNIMTNKHTNTQGEEITSLSRVINMMNMDRHEQIWTHTPKYFKNVCGSSTFNMHIYIVSSPDWPSRGSCHLQHSLQRVTLSRNWQLIWWLMVKTQSHQIDYCNLLCNLIWGSTAVVQTHLQHLKANVYVICVPDYVYMAR